MTHEHLVCPSGPLGDKGVFIPGVRLAALFARGRGGGGGGGGGDGGGKVAPGLSCRADRKHALAL